MDFSMDFKLVNVSILLFIIIFIFVRVGDAYAVRTGTGSESGYKYLSGCDDEQSVSYTDDYKGTVKKCVDYYFKTKKKFGLFKKNKDMEKGKDEFIKYGRLSILEKMKIHKASLEAKNNSLLEMKLGLENSMAKLSSHHNKVMSRLNYLWRDLANIPVGTLSLDQCNSIRNFLKDKIEEERKFTSEFNPLRRNETIHTKGYSELQKIAFWYKCEIQKLKTNHIAIEETKDKYTTAFKTGFSPVQTPRQGDEELSDYTDDSEAADAFGEGGSGYDKFNTERSDTKQDSRKQVKTTNGVGVEEILMLFVKYGVLNPEKKEEPKEVLTPFCLSKKSEKCVTEESLTALVKEFNEDNEGFIQKYSQKIIASMNYEKTHLEKNSADLESAIKSINEARENCLFYSKDKARKIDMVSEHIKAICTSKEDKEKGDYTIRALKNLKREKTTASSGDAKTEKKAFYQRMATLNAQVESINERIVVLNEEINSIDRGEIPLGEALYHLVKYDVMSSAEGKIEIVESTCDLASRMR